MSYSEILSGPLGEELRVDSGSEEEEEPMSLEELRAILEETAEDVEEDPEEHERLSESFNWSSDYSTFRGQPEVYSQAGERGPNIKETDPLKLFTHVWDHDIMNSIVAQTNEYAWQTIAQASELPDGISAHSRLNDWVETTTDELYKLFAVMIFMSLMVAGRVSEYWSTGTLAMPGFRKLMSIKRYWLLMRFLHFVDNNTISVHGSDRKVAKIQPIIDHCNKKFNSMYTPRREISIDESLLLFKGRLSWIQCIRTKAARFGIKFYELCEAVTGYLLKFEVYTGKKYPQTGDSAEDSLYGFTSASAKVVLRLMQRFLNKGHCLVMDNFYNSVTLTRFLKLNKTDVIGTLNRRRMGTPRDIQILNERKLQKAAVVSRHCGDVSVLSWKDVKLVTTVSTYHNADMLPGRRAGQQILKPVVVHDYNKYMGGVDLKDQMLSMYLMERKRGMKWYLKVFKRLINVSILNIFIIHRENSTNPLSHRQFRYKLAEQLAQKYPNLTLSRLINPPALLRLDGDNHFPIYADSLEDRAGSKRNKIKRNRCVRCSLKKIRKEVNTVCQKCQKFLCLGQCWIEYHTLENL
ncbi:piggyBac transposable element-derived protein 4-like isoform X2 [Trichoplusia ni]|nr:piggyBac transposable element-derived protein 4-like isoform X2 [Trichoplusia ni]XP_026738365.1 piggyBac transposable element-derived protein 4-like isoform X2 [Trichoplusia ni]XP_026743231.1 piggyBac transposable element-derived protein 4-like isoform X2 [Trichoplusia ni]XP_026743862.1 piggyBac transposable element-derived protein 4-like isoform X2 [Trichoplusia ni]XP_026745079.1 piggyBac transposable element-derived protein 4-like isoform X2 [Trichoplusia ni]